MFPITLTLSQGEIDELIKSVVGEGGYQSLLRKLISRVSGLTVRVDSKEEVDRIIRYSKNYGDGGFEGRLDPLAEKLKAMGL